MFTRRSGFTLIELSIVIIILSLMLGGILSAITQERRIAASTELKTKMDAIEEALLNFRKHHNRLPCPANLTLAMSNNRFGLEANVPGACQGGPIQANFHTADGTAGAVPVHTLGLPDEYMFDPWGGRFMYFVVKELTNTDAFDNTEVSEELNLMEVRDAAGNQRTDDALVIIMSHGPNGHGAYQVNGSRKSSGSINPSELINCHCTSATPPADNAFVLEAVMAPNAISSGDGDVLSIFDDIVRYYTRPQFLSTSEIITDTN